ncbi:hypothetical protein KUTeg_021059 [Tegillarca granosa]|uniref:Uncharacterized protein n=1 Tax=Tegillarca granosa TaxID=220873 RepID=A0ABQ9EDU3_TEGGR|nr:hypothetical protein KUTeg_021059 [Tegillarca granosa]
MAATVAQPTHMTRAKHWNEEVENAYRFQLAGWRDQVEYTGHKGEVTTWPNGLIKKLMRKSDECWYYFNKTRECADKDINKCKLYTY